MLRIPRSSGFPMFFEFDDSLTVTTLVCCTDFSAFSLTNERETTTDDGGNGANVHLRDDLVHCATTDRVAFRAVDPTGSGNSSRNDGRLI